MGTENDEFFEIPAPSEPKKAPQLSQTSNWMSWGTSLMQTASSLTQNLSQTINTALETGIGAPNPEQLVEIDNKGQQGNLNESIGDNDQPPQPEVTNSDEDGRLGGIIAGFGQITKLVESTGSKVITGGLDTLETIGKKTMEVIETPQRLLMNDQKINLAEVLKEAAAAADNSNTANDEDSAVNVTEKKVDFEHLFDDYQGLVHYEALEMLSKQCDIKLENIYESYDRDSNDLAELKQTMDQVTELCEISSNFGDGDDDQFDEDKQNWEVIVDNLKTAVNECQLEFDLEKIVNKFSEIRFEVVENEKFDWSNREAVVKSYVVYLAQMTSIFIESFHKMGELLFVKQQRSTANEADGVVQLTMNFVTTIQLLTRFYTEKLSADESNKTAVTNIYLDASNSQFYVKQAFQLLIPVIKLGAV